MVMVRERELEADPMFTANFLHSNYSFVGHLVSFNLGKEELKPDFNFIDPMNPSERIPVCGMLTSNKWDRQPGGILTLKGRIPTSNKGILQDMIDAHDKTAVCKFKLEFYDYDSISDSYYKCFTTDDQIIEGHLAENAISEVAPTISKDYTQIRNFEFILAILGADTVEQFLVVKSAPDRNTRLHFGQKCGGK